MSLVNSESLLDEPYLTNCGENINTLRDLFSLFSMRTKRQHTIHREENSIFKGILVLVSSILLDSGLDTGKYLVDTILNILMTTLSALQETDDVNSIISLILEEYNNQSHKNILSVHRSTVDSMLPELSKSEQDQLLEQNYIQKMDALNSFHAKSKHVILCIDETPETIHTKYQNGTLQYTHVGQKSTWEKGFEYSTIYDATNQLHLGLLHQDRYYTETERSEIRPWIQQLQKKIGVVNDAGSEVTLIEGDRGYYCSEVFGLAYMGYFNNHNGNGTSPRVLIPRKFTREKENWMWEYLLDDTRGQVFKDYVSSNPYLEPRLKAQFGGVFKRDSRGLYLIPFACIVLIDEYTAGHKRSFSDIRLECQKIQESLDNTKTALTLAENEYLAYLISKDPKASLKICYGKGRKRTKFHDSIDQSKYRRCFLLHTQLEGLQKKRTELLQSTLLMCVSLRPHEDPTRHPEMFVAFARDYHERWGIERGYEDVKLQFTRDVRSRKPTHRQRSILIGMLLYNNWHVDRLRLMLENYRICSPRRVPWDPDRPWIRRRLEQSYSHLYPADRYLLSFLGILIGILIKKKINEYC